MDALLATVNGLLCAAFAALLVACVVNPSVREGCVVKVGLILMSAGFSALSVEALGLVLAGEMFSVDRALLLTNTGAAISVLGYVRRKHHPRHPARRSSDWLPIDDNPSYWP